jgi:ligand-binding SRPBCC domain-containing protein
MPTIHITTFIAAPVERVFDLSRSIELHQRSMEAYKEEAVAGIRNGLISFGETVTWRARHFFKNRVIRVKITAMTYPEQFTDEQLMGDFKKMKHEHWFKPCDNGTIMIDLFHFETPFGLMGKIVEKLFLYNYMKSMIEQRNKVIKQYAETEKWKQLLNK